MSLPRSLGIDNCYIFDFPVKSDHRGLFMKPFHYPTFLEMQMHSSFKEDFFSVSRRNVLRGFHVMAPPRQCVKMIYLIEGAILDVALDLRMKSKTYKKTSAVELDAKNGQAVILDSGVAHAFLVLSDKAIVGYKTSNFHDPRCDVGVRWNSTSFKWPCTAPILSQRDQDMPPLDKFETPFI